MTLRHLPAKTTKATPVAFSPETGDAAALRPVGLRAGGRLKNGACEDDAPPGFTIRPVARMFRESIRHT